MAAGNVLGQSNLRRLAAIAQHTLPLREDPVLAPPPNFNFQKCPSESVGTSTWWMPAVRARFAAIPGASSGVEADLSLRLLLQAMFAANADNRLMWPGVIAGRNFAFQGKHD